MKRAGTPEAAERRLIRRGSCFQKSFHPALLAIDYFNIPDRDAGALAAPGRARLGC